MENQHRLISGYRELTQVEVDLMNRIKQKGRELEKLTNDMLLNDADPRWVAIARTELQQGLMALTRAVAKPEGF